MATRKKTGNPHSRKHIHETMTRGERIADAVADNMGSWRFIIIQSCIVAAGSSQCHRVVAALGRLSLYPPESALFDTGSVCSPSHHDEPEPAGTEGPHTG